MKPDVSIIVPVFNSAAYVMQAVNSALRQTGAEVEVVVVDDGSTDGTGEIIDEACARLTNVKVVHQAQEGSASARNRGIQEAEGRYIGFLDADDLWDPTKAACHRDVLDALPHIDLTYSWWRIIDKDGRDTGRSNTTRVNELPRGCGFAGLLVYNFTGTSAQLCAAGNQSKQRADLTRN